MKVTETALRETAEGNWCNLSDINLITVLSSTYTFHQIFLVYPFLRCHLNKRHFY